MIFAICGLTVDGTGTERAGTSSVWAWAVVKTMAAHNSVARGSFLITAVEFPAVGFFIALPCSISCCSSTQIATMRVRRLPCNPKGVQLFPQSALTDRPSDRIAARFVTRS
jgi:hypothetical protein